MKTSIPSYYSLYNQRLENCPDCGHELEDDEISDALTCENSDCDTGVVA